MSNAAAAGIVAYRMFPSNAIGQMSNPFGRLLRRVARGASMPRANTEEYAEKVRLRSPLYSRPVHHGQDGNDLLRQRLESRKPLMVGRLGATELRCNRFFLENRTAGTPYPGIVRASMSANAGFFPARDAHLDRFSEMFLAHVECVDVMGVCFNPGEDQVCNARCPDAALVEFGCLEPFRYPRPWSGALRGTTVLVVHPFAESITRQYRGRRRLLFRDPEVLPDFELKTVRAIQPTAGSRARFGTWFEAYEHMCHQIAAVDFDVALIGAGAYGLPLASSVKGMGKQAIHLGGVTQILFGIKGRRWETVYADTTARLFNPHWIRPSRAERPRGYRAIEGGAYW